MKIKILRKFPSGITEIEEIEITTFRWDNHKFFYVVINEHRFRILESNEELIGLTM